MNIDELFALDSFAPTTFSRLTYRAHAQISITGPSAVGRSTITAELMRALAHEGYECKSAGAIMRSFADERKEAIEAFAKHNDDHPEDGYDLRCERAMAEFAMKNKRIGEGRMAHIFMPYAFHVLMMCDLDVRADRRHADLVKKLGQKSPSIEEVRDAIRTRDESDQRYEKIYPGSIWPSQAFDLVVENENTTPEAVAHNILVGQARWLGFWRGALITDEALPGYSLAGYEKM